jgi:hypothetical protein
MTGKRDPLDLNSDPPPNFHEHHSQGDRDAHSPIEDGAQEAISRIVIIDRVAVKSGLLVDPPEQVVDGTEHRAVFAGHALRPLDLDRGLAAHGVEHFDVPRRVEPCDLPLRNQQRRLRQIDLRIWPRRYVRKESQLHPDAHLNLILYSSAHGPILDRSLSERE